jgi:hypothetical protein
LKALHHLLASSAWLQALSKHGFHRLNLHRLTLGRPARRRLGVAAQIEFESKF